MVFTPGWLDAVLSVMRENENLVLCGKCAALSATCDDPNHSEGEYNGAKMVIHDPAAALVSLFCPHYQFWKSLSSSVK